MYIRIKNITPDNPTSSFTIPELDGCKWLTMKEINIVCIIHALSKNFQRACGKMHT